MVSSILVVLWAMVFGVIQVAWMVWPIKYVPTV